MGFVCVCARTHLGTQLPVGYTAACWVHSCLLGTQLPVGYTADFFCTYVCIDIHIVYKKYICVCTHIAVILQECVNNVRLNINTLW